jgi:hypothetical protein
LITKVKIFIALLLFPLGAVAQHSITINAQLLPTEETIEIKQQLRYVNTSSDTLSAIYLTDWAHSFSSKQTPLAQRFAENYDKRFHLAKEEDRGRTTIASISSNSVFLQHQRPKHHPDIIKVILQEPLMPGAYRRIDLDYTVKLPDAKFSRYGVTRVKDFNLRYWFVTPAVYNRGWQYYSNKNLQDRYAPKSNININFSVPKGYYLVTDLDSSLSQTSYNADEKIALITGTDRVDVKVFLRQKSQYEAIETDFVTVITNIQDKLVPPVERALTIDRIANFLHKELGPYPHKKILVTDLDYKENPVYGLNQLPEFIRPFPEGFQYELKLLKTTINNYVDNTILVNPRYDAWVSEGIKIYLLQEYMDTFYPDLKIIGGLDKYWIIRQFYASELEFNDQFTMLYMHMARLNLDQPLTTPQDSLIKFNVNIANAYKSGAGLYYLGDFIGQEKIKSGMKQFYKEHLLTPSTTSDFEKILRTSTPKDIDWFFDDYVKTRGKIDFKISKTKTIGDSLFVTVKNKRKNRMPASIFGFRNDSLVSKTWVENIDKEKTFVLPADSVDRLVINYNKAIPEYNLRDNYKNPKSLFGFDKPLHFKLFQDFENPSKSQVFFIPVFDFNIYDGFSPGLKMYNKTILTKGLNYRIQPQYGLRSKTLIGSASISYMHNFEESNLFQIRYGISGNRFSYEDNLFFRRISPFLRFSFRTPDFRSDKRQSITARWISLSRDRDESLSNQEPDYSVFNLRYTHRNPGITNTFNYNADLQIADKFSKVSATAFYRKLYLNNRQLNLRMYAGAFLKNNTPSNDDFFSFALDRPTDYLFDYNYYGRSEDSGLFSQQYIVAEGGFKSQLQPAFADKWIVTTSASTTLWKYIYAYGDIGFVKNKGIKPTFVYDAGIQVSLLDDYFELYFPLYSNLGWEIGQPNYDQKIRFTVSISFDTVIRLFSRKWY